MLPWLSARPDCQDKRFIQAGNSLLLSTKFKALRPGARSLYISMCMESGGQREFTLPRKAALKYGFAENTAIRYTTELIDAGFIKLISSGANLRQPNIYQFSDIWKG